MSRAALWVFTYAQRPCLHFVPYSDGVEMFTEASELRMDRLMEEGWGCLLLLPPQCVLRKFSSCSGEVPSKKKRCQQKRPKSEIFYFSGAAGHSNQLLYLRIPPPAHHRLETTNYYLRGVHVAQPLQGRKSKSHRNSILLPLTSKCRAPSLFICFFCSSQRGPWI